VSTTNEIALRAVAENRILGAGVQQGQRGDAPGALLHALHFIAGALMRFAPDEFGADGVQDGGGDRGALQLRQSGGGLIDLGILYVQGYSLLLPRHLLYLLILFHLYRIVPVKEMAWHPPGLNSLRNALKTY